MTDIDLSELPSPAVHYMTPAMALSRLRAGGIAYPVSGDHTARASKARADNTADIETYIELARRR